MTRSRGSLAAFAITVVLLAACDADEGQPENRHLAAQDICGMSFRALHDADFDRRDRLGWGETQAAFGETYAEMYEDLSLLDPVGPQWDEYLTTLEPIPTLYAEMATQLRRNHQAQAAATRAEIERAESRNARLAERAGLPFCRLGPTDPPLSASPPAPLPDALTALGQVNEERARAILDAWWPRRERALNLNDDRALRRLESGSALRSDLERVLDNVGEGELAEGADAVIKDVRFMLPRGDADYFLAEVLTTARPTVLDDLRGGDPWVAVITFSRHGGESTWKADHISGYRPEGGGLDPRLVGRAHAGSEGAAAFERLASYFESWASKRAEPRNSGVVAGPYTDELGSEIAATPNGEVTDDGLVLTLSYAPDPLARSRFSYQLVDGSRMHCGTHAGLRVYESPGPDGGVVQDGDRSNWGGLVAPGTYAAMEERLFRESCILVSQSGRMDVVASRGTKLFKGRRPTPNNSEDS